MYWVSEEDRMTTQCVFHGSTNNSLLVSWRSNRCKNDHNQHQHCDYFFFFWLTNFYKFSPDKNDTTWERACQVIFNIYEYMYLLNISVHVDFWDCLGRRPTATCKAYIYFYIKSKVVWIRCNLILKTFAKNKSKDTKMQNVSIWKAWIEVFLTGINNSQNFNRGFLTLLLYFNSTINHYFTTYCCFIICVEQHLLLRSEFLMLSLALWENCTKTGRKKDQLQYVFVVFFCCNLKRLSRPQQLFQRLCSTSPPIYL